MIHLNRAFRSAVPVAVMFMLISGCFFDELQRSEESDIHRVQQKQATLQAEQTRSAALNDQEEQLAADLSGHQLSLEELNDRVQEINAANGRSIADNEAERRRYYGLITQLHQTNDQLALLQQGTPSEIEKRNERITDLKSRLKAQLDLLLR